MLYLGIDQHARQITISLRDENGDVLQARQVSRQPEKINTFFRQLTDERLHAEAIFRSGPDAWPNAASIQAIARNVRRVVLMGEDLS